MVQGRRLHHVLAHAAGESFQDMPDHLEVPRHIIERLGNVGADPTQRTAAGWTSARSGMHDLLARQSSGSGRRAGLLVVSAVVTIAVAAAIR